MACSNPPPPSDDEISALLDGDAPPEVLAHVQQCAGCAERVEHARRLERSLATSLYRWDCPSPADLGEYHLGVAYLQRRAMAAHLAHCARCSDELADLRTFLAVDGTATARAVASAPAPRRLRSIIAQLLPSSPGLQFAGVRGTGGGIVVAQCGEATVALDMSPDERGTRHLIGQIADQASDPDRWHGALVEVRGDGSLIATAFVDEYGGFACNQLSADVTDLRITSAQGLRILIEGLA
jgi:hypothetical protein